MLVTGLFINLPMFLSNSWYSGYLPFNTNKLYDRYGQRAKIDTIVDERGTLDVEKYRKFGVYSF